MERRDLLKFLGASALGLTVPVAVAQWTDRAPIAITANESTVDPPMDATTVVCRIIGVGDAGCNLVLAAWSSGVLRAKDCHTEFACVIAGSQSTEAVIASNQMNPGMPPVQVVQIASYGAGGKVDAARAAAQEHECALRSLVARTDVVILVAGVGGGTGSGVAPMLARMAQTAGALALGVVVTPFNWEIGRYPNVFRAIRDLERNTSYLVLLSNQAAGVALGEDALLAHVFALQAHEGAASINRLLMDGCRFCRDRRGPA